MMMSGAVVTAFEHETLSVGDGSDSLLSRDEADGLIQLGAARPGFCTPGYRSVRLAQYAGLVSLVGGRMLEVLPKIGEPVGAGQSRGTFLRLLKLASGVPIFSRESTSHDLHRQTLLGVFVAEYLGAVAQLVRGGLLRRYQVRTDDLRVVRGRLLVTRQATVHGMRPDRLACRFDDLTIDNAWNQILRAALMVVRPWIDNLSDGRHWRELAAAFDEVSPRRDAIELLENLGEDRQVQHYAPALRWAALILKLLSPNIRAGHSDAPECLFDMNRLFESSVAALLERRCIENGYEVAAQERNRFLLRIATPAANPVIRLKPDLVVRDAGRVVAVADTKWAQIEANGNGWMVPKESHVYQMHAYSSAYRARDLYLIYPWHKGLGRAIPTSFHLPTTDGAETQLHVVCVDVGHDELPMRVGPAAWEQLWDA